MMNYNSMMYHLFLSALLFGGGTHHSLVAASAPVSNKHTGNDEDCAATFRNLREATKSDFDRMGVEYDKDVTQKTLSNLIHMLEKQASFFGGASVSLKEHNVQTASRAMRTGEDDETITMSLFHDVFEDLAVKNHGELSSALLAPWISPKSQWLLAHHEIFQGYYYFDYYGGDKNLRDRYIDHPFYNWTVTWCELYDQASFDPGYESEPLEKLIPSVERILARPQYWWNPNHPKAGAVSLKDDMTTGESATTTIPVDSLA
jgi:predicted HD phosphohydrolase